MSYDGSYNRLELRIKNNMGFEIEISGIEIEEFEVTVTYGQPIKLANGETTEGSNNIILTDMTNADFPPPFYPTISSGEKYEIEFKLTYTNTGSGLSHTEKGTIQGKVN